MTKRIVIPIPIPVAAALALLGLSACNNSQAWHAPDFSFARMQEQPRIDPFDEGMKAPPPFTVPYDGRGPASAVPPPMTRARVEEGRARFETICATCHGIRGDGQSVVATKMLLRPPPSLLEVRIRALGDAQIADVIDHGYGFMPSYANELPPEERDDVVAYVRALQVAQGVNVTLLPSSIASALAARAP